MRDNTIAIYIIVHTHTHTEAHTATSTFYRYIMDGYVLFSVKFIY